jgi:uncharacterized MAPEG superfamily protein
MMNTVPTEVQLLAAAVVIGLVQLLLSMVSAIVGGRDMGWMTGPRDEARPIGGVPARLERAFQNFCETFPLFATALLAALLAGKSGPLTLWGAKLYVGGRALYPLAYVFTIPMARTLVWTVSVVGVVLEVAAFAG